VRLMIWAKPVQFVHFGCVGDPGDERGGRHRHLAGVRATGQRAGDHVRRGESRSAPLASLSFKLQIQVH
jgi:hypothetical protein